MDPTGPVIGHRGAAAFVRENTLAGFELAADLGCRMVELDVRLTADDVPVVFHDDALDRLTPASGPVAAWSFAALRALDPLIPTLAETLAVCSARELAVNIEIKPDRGRERLTARLALEQARRLWPASLPPPLVSSFRDSCLDQAARTCPAWPRALLRVKPSASSIRRAVALGCVAIHADQRYLGPARIKAILAAGLSLRAYTVNDSRRATALLDDGVAALFSDDPALLGQKTASMS